MSPLSNTVRPVLRSAANANRASFSTKASGSSTSPAAILLYSYIVGSCILPFVAPAVDGRRNGSNRTDGKQGGPGLHHCC